MSRLNFPSTWVDCLRLPDVRAPLVLVCAVWVLACRVENLVRSCHSHPPMVVVSVWCED